MVVARTKEEDRGGAVAGGRDRLFRPLRPRGAGRKGVGVSGGCQGLRWPRQSKICSTRSRGKRGKARAPRPLWGSLEDDDNGESRGV